MRLVLFLVLLAVPLIELALLIKLGQAIGLWPTVAIVIGTALLGASVLHRQGMSTLRRAVEMTEHGAAPLEPAVDGVFLLVAGILLLTPGLLTDLTGLALLIPPLRRAIAHRAFAAIMQRATVEVHTGRWTRTRRPGQTRPGPHGAAGDNVIEGEFERLDDREPPRSEDPAGRRR